MSQEDPQTLEAELVQKIDPFLPIEFSTENTLLPAPQCLLSDILSLDPRTIR